MGAHQRPKPSAPRTWVHARAVGTTLIFGAHTAPVSALQGKAVPQSRYMAARLPRCPRLGPLGRPQGSRSARSRRAALGVALRPVLFRDPESEFARSVTFPLRPHVSPTAFLLGRLSRPRAVRPRSLAPSPARCLARSLAPSLPPILADPRPQRRPRGFSGGKYLDGTWQSFLGPLFILHSRLETGVHSSFRPIALLPTHQPYSHLCALAVDLLSAPPTPDASGK